MPTQKDIYSKMVVSNTKGLESNLHVLNNKLRMCQMVRTAGDLLDILNYDLNY